MSQPAITRESESVYRLDPARMLCEVPQALVDARPVLCAGIQFQRIDENHCELVFLSEAAVERLTGPEDDRG